MNNVVGLRRSLVARFYREMSSKFSYENAVRKLNLLQSNKATIAQIRNEIRTGHKCTNLEDMENYLLRVGIPLSKLDQLSVIHVAGTKGKGSTSAMCESILRHHGYNTGFFSSPHLVSVCERIRLNGLVISKEAFADYFHTVYDRLDRTKSCDGDMPKYFAFLTVMAFHVFLQERVEVAVVEVGIGGVVDYTNILRNVPVAGITALGLDHTSILGNTIEEIAAAKAGIMKPSCEAYTVPQPPEAMDVLEAVAKNVRCPLHIAPDYNTYQLPKGIETDLPVDLAVYRDNASLSIQLAHAWMRIHQLNIINKRNKVKKHVITKIIRQNDFTEIESAISEDQKLYQTADVIQNVPEASVAGLRLCKWPGRYQEIRTNYAQFYLDGAHTKESMEVCAKWFIDKSRLYKRILVFSATGDRDAEILLKPLLPINFQHVFFVIPTSYKEVAQSNDNFSAMEQRDLIERCNRNAETWKKNQSNTNISISVLECVSDALIAIKNDWTNSSVLITGSLHLVGASLSILEPN